MAPTNDAFHATTVACVRHKGRVALAGDGQVSIGQTIVKAGARKVRKVYHGGVLAGVAGAAAGAFPLFAKVEGKRSEERRVGEEGRFRGGPDYLKKKDNVTVVLIVA